MHEVMCREKPLDGGGEPIHVYMAVGLAQEGGCMMVTIRMVLVLTVVVGLLGSCATAPASREDKAALVAEATSRWQQMRTADPALGPLVQRGHGYALFPDVGKAGLGVGGAYGRGVVYERGQHIGYSDLTQGTVGAQVGGQSFSELLVFEHKAALERFKAGQLGFAAGASAVVLKSGVATNPNFVDGVAVVVQPIGGVMVEAAIGGQQFTYQAK
jgi:lipid-binding SYLF domain-containing protein